MAREGKSDADQFDIDGLRQLMELMEKYDVREFRLHRGDVKYLLRRGPQEVVAAVPAGVPTYAANPAGSGEATTVAADEHLVEIKSPTVGTFYQAQAPGEPPFVRVGDQIHPDSIVCIVEAMKVFNQIPSGVSGTIAKVLVADGDAVEYGQPMFRVKPV